MNARRNPQLTGSKAGHGSKFPRKMEAAIAALLTHGTVKHAAEHVGIGEKTLRRWMEDPAFRQRFDAARAELLDTAMGVLRRGSTQCAIELIKLAIGEKTNDAIKLGACRTVLEFTLRWQETQELVKRIEALEQKDSSQKGGFPWDRLNKG